MHWVLRLHRGKLIGAGVGLGVALLVMWVGWLWSLLILAFMLVGGATGGWLVDSQTDVDLVDE
jgi:hypothetical protein